jgi:hypothetical protein
VATAGWRGQASALTTTTDTHPLSSGGPEGGDGESCIELHRQSVV